MEALNNTMNYAAGAVGMGRKFFLTLPLRTRTGIATLSEALLPRTICLTEATWLQYGARNADVMLKIASAPETIHLPAQHRYNVTDRIAQMI